MSDAGERHGHIVFVGRFDNFVVAHGATRLNHHGRSPFNGLKKTVGKGEERI
jgi:hypothetical protein